MSSDESKHWLRAVAAHADLDLTLTRNAGHAEVRKAWPRVVQACKVPEDQFVKRVARHFRIGVADLSSWDPQAVRLLPQAVAREHGVLPLSLTDSNVLIATSDPHDGRARREIIAHTSRQPIFLLASPAAVAAAINKAYTPTRTGQTALQALITEAATDDFAVVSSDGRGQFTSFALEAPAVVKLADLILQRAVRNRATEIHMQPGQKRCIVRYRIDGVLVNLAELPPSAHERLVGRLDHMAFGLPESDGTFPVEHGGIEVEAHLAKMATPDGELVTIRLVAPEAIPTLEGLGIDGPERAAIRDMVAAREGLVLVCGPARSGKTSFIYAMLSAARRLNVVSLENPVELHVPGITQLQYDPSTGRSFADTVGDLLNQDPDLIHAGELRDLATARIALRAAVTGRKVLCTVHTSDAVSGVRRLMDMGLAPGRLAESLKAVIALRLVRQLCPSCAARVTGAADLPKRELQLAKTAGVLPAKKAVGCPECAGIGYRGQVPVAEILSLTPALISLLMHDPSDAEIERAARAEGMRTLAEAAMGRVRQGQTTLEEVSRVLGVIPPREETTESVGPVLVVEDEPTDRLIIKTSLEALGFRVVEAEDGAKAQEMLAAGDTDFSLVLLDLFLPEVHGRDVLRGIRSSPATQTLPVIVLTGSQELTDEIELLEAGADDFLRKPIVPERLEARVRAVLRRLGVKLGSA